MNLSRAAKKFRTTEPKSEAGQKPAASKKAAKAAQQAAAQPPVAARMPAEPPAPKPPVAPPVVEVAAPAPMPPEPKPFPVKVKRPRFVREKTEKRERVALPPLPAPSSKPVVRLMTKNLAVLPRDDAPDPGR